MIKNRVLIIEDDAVLRDLYKRSLSDCGFVTSVLEDSEGIFEVITEFTPDIIMLDLMLPHKSGHQVLLDLKKKEKTQEIPVVIATNYGTKENVEQCLKDGAEDVILKYNVTPSEIGEKLWKILNPAKVELPEAFVI